MKHNYFITLLLILVIIPVVVWLIACEEKEDFTPIRIESLSPGEVLIGDTLKIIGEGFSPGVEYNRVYFEGVPDAILPMRSGSNESELWVRVPEGALSGLITVNLFNEEIGQSPEALVVKAPEVERVEPAAGIAGDTVTIYGKNFRPELTANKVSFNPPNREDPKAWAPVINASAKELKVVIPVESRTGKINILGFTTVDFTILPPSITSVDPLKGVEGDTIEINGRGFGSYTSTSVKFSGTDIQATVLPSSTSKKLKVIVPAGAGDGTISVSYSGNTLVSDGIFEIYPSITGISPRNGISGMAVTINGTSFSDVIADNTVKFGDRKAEIKSATKTRIQAVVPPGTITAPVSVTVNNRLAPGPQFEISSDGTPVIFSINPSSGPAGSLISIAGDYFSDILTENIVTFKTETAEAPAEVISVSRTALTVKVPPLEVVKCLVTVTIQNKTGTGPEFTYTARAVPFITSISPDLVKPGSEFKIQGGNFTVYPKDIGISILVPGGLSIIPSASTETEITATLPGDARAGEYIVVATMYNKGSNQDKTIVIEGSPSITGLSATEGFSGAILELTGTSFHNIENKNKVEFSSGSSAKEASFVDVNDTNPGKVRVFVPDLPPGAYDVSLSAFGNTSNKLSFTVKEKPAAVKNVYYTKLVTSPGGVVIEKATFDPPNVGTVYRSTASSLNSLVVDIQTAKAYLLHMGSGEIWRTNLDNTGATLLYSSQTAVWDLTLDATGGKLYWSKTNTILRGDARSSAEGGAAASVIYTGASGTVIRGLTYSRETNKIYFSEVQASTSSYNISSIDLDDPAPYTKTVVVAGSSTLIPLDVKVDEVNDKLFMLASSAINSRKSIYMAELGGPSNQILTLFYTLPSTPADMQINGIALDIADKYVYWIKNKDDNTDAAGIFRKRYDQQTIPGSDPPATVQKIYSVANQSTAIMFGGLAIEDLSQGSSATQRRTRNGARSMSSALTIEMNFNNNP